ncbi:MAG TPA: hypothetical protein VGF29_15170 [Hyphomicrobiaceae bacterium]|jgi:hypothetical protein
MFRVPSHPAQEMHEKVRVYVSSSVSCVRGVRLRGVSEVSEFGSASRPVPAFSGAFELRSASEYQSRQSPKMALGPTLQGLKRAAEARKVQRIAGRLAALAGRNRARTADRDFAETIRRPFDA